MSETAMQSRNFSYGGTQMVARKKSVKKSPNKMTISASKSSIYEKDFCKWVASQTLLLKKRQFEEIDVENLIEEIESLGKSDRRALKSHLIIILLHMLKHLVQPDMQENSNSWNASIQNSRLELDLLLEDSPSLNNEVDQMIEKAYSRAREEAIRETGCKEKMFPKKCPWAKTEILGKKK